MMVNLDKLERTIIQYCSELVNKHKKQRRYVYKDNKCIWDLPCVAVSCAYDATAYSDFSKPTRSDTYKKVPKLEETLLTLGKIGEHVNGRYPIGHCAEPHAAKKCMKDNQKALPNNIYFSTARVVRTKEIIDYCDNCKATFVHCNDIQKVIPVEP
jgi:hypothetical protein